MVEDKIILNKEASKKLMYYLENPNKVPILAIIKNDDYKDIIKYNQENEEKALNRILKRYGKT